VGGEITEFRVQSSEYRGQKRRAADNAEERRSRQKKSFDRINRMNKKIDFDPV
jgi:hypothetical protein